MARSMVAGVAGVQGGAWSEVGVQFHELPALRQGGSEAEGSRRHKRYTDLEGIGPAKGMADRDHHVGRQGLELGDQLGDGHGVSFRMASRMALASDDAASQ